MNFSFRQLKAFTLVAHLGNFTRAAEHLHITQAGLSVMMRELEKQLGTRMFDRTTRAVTLSPAGARFLPSALSALAELERASAEITNIGNEQRRTLRIAATPVVSSSLMPSVFGSFRKTQPDVDIQLADCEMRRVNTLVESGDVDIGLGLLLEHTSGIDRTLLCSFQLMRVGAIGECGPVPWSSLQDMPMVCLPVGNPIQRLVDLHLPKPTHPEPPRPRFSHVDTIIAMVAAGMGTAVLPTFAMNACQRYDVRTGLLCDPAVSVGFYSITRQGSARSALMQEFTATMLSVLPSLDRAPDLPDSRRSRFARS
jgi:DNA-binding transcriptional LysR family regulator